MDDESERPNFDQAEEVEPGDDLDQQLQLELGEVEEGSGNHSSNNNTKDQDKHHKSMALPLDYFKAKRTLTKLVNELMNSLKQQFLKATAAQSTKNICRFVYARENIPAVESAISQLITIQYVQFSTIVAKKSEIVEDFLLSYVPEANKILKYNMNISKTNADKPRELILSQQEGELPDSATPAAFGANAYLFDPAKFDLQRMTYTPIMANFKVNLITGRVSKLTNQPSLFRMKCCILKAKRGFFIVGGFAGEYKSITRKCSFFTIQTQQFHDIDSLNLLHSCPSGCVHQSKVYVFSSAGIEVYDDKENVWRVVEKPRRLRVLPFQYCISVSASEILLIGGRECNRSSTSARLYNTETGSVDEYTDVLPVGACSERCWGPMVVNSFIAIMSNMQASIRPYVTVKGETVQLVLVGFGGCFLNTLVVQPCPPNSQLQ